MKRDWDLLREILYQAESCEAGRSLVLSRGTFHVQDCRLDAGGHSFEEVYEHVLLLKDSGFAEVRELPKLHAGPMGIAIDRLTMRGQDFLEAARDDTRWRKAMKTVSEKGGAVTVSVLTQILSALTNKSLGL